MSEELVKIVVFAPENYADKIRKALGKAGAGKMGNYRFCSFSAKGIGRFLPEKNAKPTIGKIDKLQEVKEERIETICRKKDLKKIIAAIKKAHPYEEPAIDIIPLINF